MHDHGDDPGRGSAREGGEQDSPRAWSRPGFLNTLLESSINAIGIADHQGKMVYVNANLLKMWGYERRSEIVGRPVQECWEGDGIDRTFAELRSKGGSIGEDTGKKKDGSVFPVQYSASLIKEADGTIFMLGSFVDITERQEMEERLRASEELHRSLVRSLPCMVYHGVGDWSAVKIGAFSKEVSGYTAREFESGAVRWADIIHEDDRQRVFDEVGAHESAVNRNLEQEYRIIRKDGEARWVRDIKKVLFEDGLAMGAKGVVTDITERKQAELALRESERHYRTLVETSPDAILIIDPSGRVIRCNHQGARLYGLDAPAQLVGRDFRELFPPGAADAGVDPSAILTVSEGGLRDVEISQLREDGTTFTATISTAALDGDGDQPESILSILHDITDRKAIQEKLVQADRLAGLGILAAGLAHEMNNPLSVLLGYVDLMQTRFNSLATEIQEQLTGHRRSLRRIGRAGQRCKDIVHDLLTFAQPSAMDKASLRLSAIIDEAILQLGDQLQERRISVTRELEPGVKISGHRKQLLLVFSNLFLNALYVTEEGGALIARSYLDGPSCVTEICDSGPGISDEDLKRIFVPFFTTKPVGEGMGLGLSIVHGIVHSHGGEVTVGTSPGKGTTFRIKLPALDGGR